MEKTKKAPNRIREERKNKKMNIDELAKLIGVSRATINNYETGTHDPKLTTWKALSDIFGVDIGYLQGVSDVKNADLEIGNKMNEITSGLKDFITEINSVDESSDQENKAREMQAFIRSFNFEGLRKHAWDEWGNKNLEQILNSFFDKLNLDFENEQFIESLSSLSYKERAQINRLLYYRDLEYSIGLQLKDLSVAEDIDFDILDKIEYYKDEIRKNIRLLNKNKNRK